MMDLFPDTDLYDLRPLLQLGIAKYRLAFTTAVPVKAHALAALFRSRLGYVLKGRFCLFQNYQAATCDDCGMSSCCAYPVLFAPTHEHIDKVNTGHGKPQATPPRPYALDVAAMRKDKILMPDEKHEVELTLFGSRAISFQRPMLESLIHATASVHKSRLTILPEEKYAGDYPLTPLSWSGLVPELRDNHWDLALKDEAFIAKGNMENSLERWIMALPGLKLDKDFNGTPILDINLRTPFQLERAEKKLTFTCFLQSVFSRLRDLKRNYHPDNGMGNFSKQFHSRADSIRTFCDIEKTSHTWYSYRQERDVNIGGLEGSLMFKGDIEPFIPLIAAGFLIGVGRKVAYGLGWFDMAQYALWQSKKANDFDKTGNQV